MMEAEPKRTLAYLCPACGQSVAVERTAFQLAASANELPCPCGKSALRVELEGVRARLTVPCLFCGTEHTVTCPAEALLNERVLAFSCAASGLDCCYVGEEGPVFAALKRLEEAADKLDPGNRGAGTFLDELVMHEVLSELREIAGRNGISCACGSRRYAITVRGGAVDLVCQDCGGKLRIGAATDEDLDQLCCRYTLTIPGSPAADGGSGAKP